MDTITTIPSLLTFSGSAQPVMVALTPKDSRLIAAAPELLDACSTFLRSMRTSNVSNGAIRNAENAARAAIAKATGEQP